MRLSPLLLLLLLVSPGFAQSPEFAKVTGPRPFVFPADHGKHADYQTEWWYFTGLLATAAGREFGVQMTIFRQALTPALDPARTSAWGVRDLYLAHFAIADLQTKEFHVAQRLARGAVDLAGASDSEFRVWVQDWFFSPGPHDDDFDFFFPATEEGIGFDASTETAEPIVRHGAQPGYSIKSVNGNASHYYSIPLIATNATITVGGRTFLVEGELWMDHEWGTNQLESNQQGWDWFALDFDDGASLMLFQIRRTDGLIDPISSGTWIAPDGAATYIPPGTFTLTPSDAWTSQASGARYPTVWRIQIPAYGVDCTSRARLASTELVTTDTTGITYWEGPVAIAGTHTGTGYLEMTGYADNVGARF